MTVYELRGSEVLVLIEDSKPMVCHCDHICVLICVVTCSEVLVVMEKNITIMFVTVIICVLICVFACWDSRTMMCVLL